MGLEDFDIMFELSTVKSILSMELSPDSQYLYVKNCHGYISKLFISAKKFVQDFGGSNRFGHFTLVKTD